MLHKITRLYIYYATHIIITFYLKRNTHFSGINAYLPNWIFHISAGEFCDAAQKPLLSVQQASCDHLFSSYG
jgi:uncharacterized membrane protein